MAIVTFPTFDRIAKKYNIDSILPPELFYLFEFAMMNKTPAKETLILNISRVFSVSLSAKYDSISVVKGIRFCNT